MRTAERHARSAPIGPEPRARVRLRARMRLGTLILSTVVGCAVGCRRARTDDGDSVAESASAGGPPRRVRCAPAQARELRDTLELHGTISPLPDRDALIAPQVPGRILQVLVREGERVKRDQALAHIEDAALRDQATQTVAQLAKARAETHLAATSRERIQRVFDRGIAARQELDDAVARVATAEANEAEARASREIIIRQLARAIVRSPLPGVVLRVFRKTGELVDGTAATPIVEVGDPSSLELVGTATAAALVRSKVGAAATIDIPALPSLKLTGLVAAVSPAVDRVTGLGTVRVSLNLQPDVSPPVGVTGAAYVETGPSRLATMVPSQALRAGIGAEAEAVICGPDKRARVVRVGRGAVRGDLTEVVPLHAPGDIRALSATVSPGVRVAVEPVLGLSDGDALDPVP